MTTPNLTFQVCETPSEIQASQDAEMALIEGLGNNILEHLGDIELGRTLKIFIRDESNKVVGGVVANCFGGWMYISLLWVEKSLRNQGYGARLMKMIEAKASEWGCQDTHIDTYSFEAKSFYDQLGYTVFGVLEDYPPGCCKYFMRKHLRK